VVGGTIRHENSWEMALNPVAHSVAPIVGLGVGLGRVGEGRVGLGSVGVGLGRVGEGRVGDGGVGDGSVGLGVGEG